MSGDERPPEFPPETYRWMSWAAIQFINRPSSRVLAWVSGGLFALLAAGFVSIFHVEVDSSVESRGDIVSRPALREAVARSDGQMGALLLAPGARVSRGQAIAQLLVETPRGPERLIVKSPTAGTLTRYEVETDENLRAGQVVALVAPEGAALVARLPLAAEDVPSVAPGQPVKLSLDAYPLARYGSFAGEVIAIEPSRREDGWHLYHVLTSVLPPAGPAPGAGPELPLAIGMKLRGRVVIGRRPVSELLSRHLFGGR